MRGTPDPQSAITPEPSAPTRSSFARASSTGHAIDVVVALALTTIAFLTRYDGLPTDGLFYDDSIVAAATKDTIAHLFQIGFLHPLFTAGLMLINPFSGYSSTALAYPALVAGVIAPPLLYLVLTRLGYGRTISLLLAAALLAADTHIVYSGRVKTYTIDLLLMLGLVILVPRLARVRWDWRVATLWVLVAAAIGCMGMTSLIAAAAASLIFLVSPVGDMKYRLVATGAVGAVYLSILVALLDYNSERINAEWIRTWDAFPTLDVNPLRSAGEIFLHLRRIGIVFPGGAPWWAGFATVAAIAGLVVASRRGQSSTAVRARYCLLVLAVALAAGLLELMPFGPAQGGSMSLGGRVTIWMIPFLAFGLALALQSVRLAVARRSALRTGFDLVCVAAAVSILVAGFDRAPSYPFPGSKSSTEWVESELQANDAVILTQTSFYTFAYESDFEVRFEERPNNTPATQMGPIFEDPRIHLLDSDGTADQVQAAVDGAERVFVHTSERGVGSPTAAVVLELTLAGEGFAKESAVEFEDALVVVWSRGEAS